MILMWSKFVFFICILLLSGCSLNETSSCLQKKNLNEEQLVRDFKNQGIKLVALKKVNSVFNQKLFFTRPKVYGFKKDKYYIYIFKKVGDVGKAEEKFK